MWILQEMQTALGGAVQTALGGVQREQGQVYSQ
jgi:hypothetical protein